MYGRKRTFIAIAAIVLMLIAVMVSGCMGSAAPVPIGDIQNLIPLKRSGILSETTPRSTGIPIMPLTGYGQRTAGLPSHQLGYRSRRQKALPSPAPLPSAAGVGATEHSETNVQIAGVYEPDFVKNDARYIYDISGRALTIVDTCPASSAAILSRTELEDSTKEIFISGDRLVLLKTGTSAITGSDKPVGTNVASKMAVMPRYPY